MLDGGSKVAGFLKKVEGGDIKADVIAHKVGLDNMIMMHIGQPNYGDIKVQVGFSMSPGFYEWIQMSWDRKYIRKSGQIVALDSNSKARSVRDFYDALITEVGIPALDASAKDPCYMTVGWAPERIRYKEGDQSEVKAEFTPHQKAWLPSNFHFSLGDLDTSHVSKIDAFTVKQSKAKHEVGEKRDAQIEPGALEFPDIKIMITEESSKGWWDWANDFIINGNCGEANQKAGAIEFRSPDQKAIGRIELQGVGIKSIAPEASEGGGDAIKKVAIELYVEQMKLVPDMGRMVKVG